MRNAFRTLHCSKCLTTEVSGDPPPDRSTPHSSQFHRCKPRPHRRSCSSLRAAHAGSWINPESTSESEGRPQMWRTWLSPLWEKGYIPMNATTMPSHRKSGSCPSPGYLVTTWDSLPPAAHLSPSTNHNEGLHPDSCCWSSAFAR